MKKLASASKKPAAAEEDPGPEEEALHKAKEIEEEIQRELKSFEAKVDA